MQRATAKPIAPNVRTKLRSITFPACGVQTPMLTARLFPGPELLSAGSETHERA